MSTCLANAISGQLYRLPAGGLVDRRSPLSFQFDGKRYTGYRGDTLASSLLAAGERLIGRSFKYHRPRGILTAGPEEPNALVELRAGPRREPNTRATTAELYDGLKACSQNRWPSLAFDLGAINSLFSPLFVAGFYYKTFMWPAAMWEKLYEPAIRRAAGLGRASLEHDPDVYDRAHAFCDVLVIGAGPAGLAAALSAGRSGARVILCDEDFLLGGRLNAERREINGESGSVWARQVETELASLPEVRILPRTTVFGVYDGSTYAAIERVADHRPVPTTHEPRQRFWQIIAKRAVLATGAIERPIVFGGNDRPGVMMASAVRAYLNRFGVLAGRRVAIFTATDDGWRTAIDLIAEKVGIAAVVDTRDEVAPSLVNAVKRCDAPILLGAQVLDVYGAHRVSHLTVRDGKGHSFQIATDALAVSGGWSPNIALSTHLGGRPRWNEGVCAFLPGDLPKGMTFAGAAGGSFALADALREGTEAGLAAAESTGHRAVSAQQPTVDDDYTALTGFWYVRGSKQKSFVDFQHDVTEADIALAIREGFRSPEHLKRYTTLGMGTDQGKLSNLNGLSIVASLTSRSVPELGTTTFRPPYSPISIGAIAAHHRGRDFRPARLTASHDWAQAHGATFVEAGQWLRARWFSSPADKDWLATVTREVEAVRSRVGVCDVSTLGKIDVQGPDAGLLLDRIYINKCSNLPVGKVRYGLMLREDGFAMDDGTTARLGTSHFLVSTTTINAAKVMQHLEFARQVLFPQLDVQIVSVTEQWAQYAIAGPNSRDLVNRLLGRVVDLSNASFPYLACREFSWSGVPTRLFRISYSGELSYELAVPARYGESLIRALMDAGSEWGVAPYGTEALGVMRIEKGHIGGNEINGTTTAADLGLGRMISADKDFIGRVLAQRSGVADVNRPALVGLKPLDRAARLQAGAHFLPLHARPSLKNDQGYLTSVAFSPSLRQWIGLGFVARGRERHGEHLRAFDPLRGSDVEVQVVAPTFLDAEGARLRS